MPIEVKPAAAAGVVVATGGASVGSATAATVAALSSPEATRMFVKDSDSPLKIQARARSFPMHPALQTQLAEAAISPAKSLNSKPHTQSSVAKPAQFALALEHTNQDPAEQRRGPPSPPTSAGSTSPTTTTTLASPTSDSATTTTAAAAADEPIQELPISNPESPAYMALVKANDSKPDASLLDKRMRIGKAKIGRTKYNADRSFKKPMGNEIHHRHEQYALTYGMMCGILNSAGLQNPFKQRLAMDDFMRVEKRSFPANSKLQHPFKFKDYSPDIFRQIRRRFCIDSADYMVTLCGDFNYIEFLSNSKSGQFFFYSHDGRFMIKTQTKDESKFLRRILPHYYKFAMENPNTLITRFYGMHRVKMHHLRRKMHFIIMASVFDTPLEIHTRFDLKGSQVGRRATPKERTTGGVLKDMDLLDSGFRLHLGAERRAMLLVQIRRDVEFLKRMKIMDYSMLIGVHDSQHDLQTTLDETLNAAAAEIAATSASGSRSVPSSPTKIATEQPLVSAAAAAAAATATTTTDAAVAPVRMMRSLSVPTRDAPDAGDCRPAVVPLGHLDAVGYRLSEATTAVVSPSVIDLSLFEFDSDDESDDDSDESESSDSGESSFAVDGGSFSSISPRILDVESFPAHSESIFCRDEGGIYGRDRYGRKNGFVYFVGVIDILQQYNSLKIAETFFKGMRHNRKHISSVHPVFYGDRFIEFMEQHVVQDDTLAGGANGLVPPPLSRRMQQRKQHEAHEV